MADIHTEISSLQDQIDGLIADVSELRALIAELRKDVMIP